jgi:hypothetical protein
MPIKESDGGGSVEGDSIHSRARNPFANNPRTTPKGVAFIRSDPPSREAFRERSAAAIGGDAWRITCRE